MLTIRDTARPLVVPVTYLGAAKDPWGNARVGFEAESHHQPQGFRSELERRARNGRIPGRRRSEDQRDDAGDRRQSHRRLNADH